MGEMDDDLTDDSDWEEVIHTSDEEDDTEHKEHNEIPNGSNNTQVKDDFLTVEEKEEKAKLVTASRILSDAEFKKIESAQLKKQVQAIKKGKKRNIREEHEDENEIKSGLHRDELVSLANI